MWSVDGVWESAAAKRDHFVEALDCPGYKAIRQAYWLSMTITREGRWKGQKEMEREKREREKERGERERERERKKKRERRESREISLDRREDESDI